MVFWVTSMESWEPHRIWPGGTSSTNCMRQATTTELRSKDVNSSAMKEAGTLLPLTMSYRKKSMNSGHSLMSARNARRGQRTSCTSSARCQETSSSSERGTLIVPCSTSPRISRSAASSNTRRKSIRGSRRRKPSKISRKHGRFSAPQSVLCWANYKSSSTSTNKLRRGRSSFKVHGTWRRETRSWLKVTWSKRMTSLSLGSRVRPLMSLTSTRCLKTTSFFRPNLFKIGLSYSIKNSF